MNSQATMTSAADKKIIVIAGPNGAGKTVFAGEFLPEEAGCPAFINADLIAAGLAPFAPEAAAFKAGRLMLAEIHSHARKGGSFSFETTLSGRRYARLIPQWQSSGYHVKLIFLRLESPELAVARVARRVLHGGHDIHEPVIRRRYAAGLHNLDAVYMPLVDEWTVYDTSGPSPVLLGRGVKP